MPCHFCHQFTERRVIYNFEKYGDSPACVGKDRNIKNQIALTQGFGLTENTKDLLEERPLLETNVTIISNDECYNKFKMVDNVNIKSIAKSAMPNGVTDQMLCTLGILKQTGNVTVVTVSLDILFFPYILFTISWVF